MTLPLGLKNLVDERQIKWIVNVAPDELAPQLGKVIRELLYEEDKHLREVGIYFIKTTVLTDTFKEILRSVFETIRRNGVFTKWLNLDMGSGKTHLLALITYLLHAYDVFAEELDEYRMLGLDQDIARQVALLVIDLRTPSELLSTFLQFFAKSLRKARENDAARYVEECLRIGVFPEASELVRRLRSARLAIIIDELHHAILVYRTSENERKIIEKTLGFVTQLINYLRLYGRGFVILVASARRDYERFHQISQAEDALGIMAESLISQLGRIEPVLETKWLSTDEAKHIVIRKLNAKQDIFHPMFNKFIERLIKAESDIPQAQHLRSLIKAMAIYTDNALELGHSKVSPMCFSEGVVDALFPEGGGIAERYRSIYSTITREIEDLEGVSNEVKGIARLIVNTIFTMSISGRPDQLIETIRAYKLGRYTLELLPAISEKEILGLLEELGFKDYQKISKAFDILNSLPYIHSVRFGNTYVYFVVPVESVVALFNKHIEERYRYNLGNRESMIEKFIQYIHIPGGEIDEDTSLKVVSNRNDLEAVTKGLNPDKMYIIIYAEPEFVKYLEESLRSSVVRDIDNVVNAWFNKCNSRDIVTWLNEHHKHNIAIVIPTPSEEVIKGVARFHAIEESIGKVVNDYLIEYSKSSSSLSEEMKRLIEIELTEIHNAIKDKFIDALRSFTNAYSKALRYVYVYECNYSVGYGLRCSASGKELKLEDNLKINIHVDPSKYNELIDMLMRQRDNGIDSILKQLAKDVKKYANFIDESQKAREIITKHVVDALKSDGAITVREDMNTYPYGSQVFYIPPSVVVKAVNSIAEDKLRELVGGVVIKKSEPKGISFKVEGSIKEVTQDTTSKPSLGLEEPMDEFSQALKKLESSEGGVISLLIEFSKESKSTIRTHLNVLKKYIKKIEVRSS